MVVASLYSHAIYDAYPFTPGWEAYGDLVLANHHLVDAMMVFGEGSTFDHSVAVTLRRVVADASNLTFVFGDGTTELSVAVPRDADPGETVSFTSDNGFGWVQVGDLSDITAVANGTHSPSGQLATLEPSRTMAMGHRRVTSLNLANKYTTLFWDTECDGERPEVTDTHAVEAEDLQGHLVLRPGRFAVVSQLDAANRISLAAARSAQEGGAPPCGTDLAVRPAGWTGQAPECAQTVATLNGTGPNERTGAFSILGSRGVTVSRVSAHRLKITIHQSVLFQPRVDGSSPCP